MNDQEKLDEACDCVRALVAFVKANKLVLSGDCWNSGGMTVLCKTHHATIEVSEIA